MLESGIICYGEDFMKSMEEGKWDLSKVDENELKESKAAFVYGQMNEPPGARARVALSGLTLAEYFREDRKSTRLNSSHVRISYAVFCLKKKTKTHTPKLT